MKEKVKEFYNYPGMKDAVQDYFKEVFEQKALEMVYKGEETEQMHLAYQIINRVFHQMDVDFMVKTKKDDSRIV